VSRPGTTAPSMARWVAITAINTRAELQKELPEFYQFLSELLPQDNQYEDCYANP